MKALVFLLLAAILLSLGTGLYYLTSGNRDSTRLLMALKIRLALSAVLILFLVLAYYLGWIPG